MYLTALKFKSRRVYWNIVGQPDFPPPDFKLIDKINRYTGAKYAPRSQRMAHLYKLGIDLQIIADLYGVTRERVRQCLWKGYREYEKSLDDRRFP